ncbi:MAG: hypothetical protein AMJ64_09915 [Betaproteobacteria bacterium SG8_39]|nr:MAG: hypothetical protein AMJ64_09915 [Betaproteobacteria bacterium SG8_39]
MYGVVGVLLLCLGLLVARAGIVGARMTPVPAWLSDAMQSYVVVPFIVTAIVIGLGASGTWLLGGHWKSETVLGWGGMAAIIVGYWLANRAVRAWAQSRPAAVPLSLVEGGRPQDPSRPPQQPPLKKAA